MLLLWFRLCLCLKVVMTINCFPNTPGVSFTPIQMSSRRSAQVITFQAEKANVLTSQAYTLTLIILVYMFHCFKEISGTLVFILWLAPQTLLLSVQHLKLTANSSNGIDRLHFRVFMSFSPTHLQNPHKYTRVSVVHSVVSKITIKQIDLRLLLPCA